jgi:hypothetical protein
VLVRDGGVHPIDYANASPDVAVTSLHYYFPWAIRTLVRWAAFCAVTRRRMRVYQDSSEYFGLGDDESVPYEEKLDGYRRLAEEYFSADEYGAFCDEALPHAGEATVELVESPEFDELLVSTVRSTFPPHEHEQFVAHYRGLLAAWARDQR